MNKTNPVVEFRSMLRRDSYQDLLDVIDRLVEERGVRRVCDVGGGANPSLTLEQVDALGLEYTLLDISQDELDKAPDGYLKVCADITAPSLSIDGGFDLVFSRQLAEHVRDGRTFHRNVFGLLKPGGRAVHYFPMLYTLPMLVNRVLPEALLHEVNLTLWPHRTRESRHAKFPAWYSWCFGPCAGQFERFASLGFEVEHYVGYFGHSYYEKVPSIASALRWFSDRMTTHPVWPLTSGALVQLHRPPSRRLFAPSGPSPARSA